MHVSLRSKVLLGVLLPFSLILGAFAYRQHIAHRSMMLAFATQTGTHVGGLIEASLAEAMMDDDRDRIRLAIDGIAASTDVHDLFLLNNESEVRVAPSGRGEGLRLSTAIEGCNACHGPDAEHLGERSAVIELPAVGRVLRNCSPIENRPQCHGCHEPDDRYNGILITDISLDTIDGHLAADLRQLLLSLSGAIVIGGILLSMTMNQLVIGPLTHLTDAVRGLARGELGRRAEGGVGDELHELGAAFNHMADGLQDRRRLERQVSRRTAELERLNETLREQEAARAKLLENLIHAQEEERKRVARQLHDELAQTLTGLLMSLDAADTALAADWGAAPEARRVREQLGRTRDIVGRSLDQTRRLILDLRPTMLDDLGLVSAVRWYAETHLASTGALVTVRTEGKARSLRPELATALFRIAQEAINNIVRYAQAGRVRILLTWEPKAVVMKIEDDGTGFDVPAVLEARDPHMGFGLLGMRERAGMIGASLVIASQVGTGTRIELRLQDVGSRIESTDANPDR
jgi:signal transduction histidine kinase/mono/diheme cytochrome c family protein